MQPPGSRIYEIRVQSKGRVLSRGARLSRADAEELLHVLSDQAEAAGRGGTRFWIEEVDTTGLYEIPSRPTPRERYTIRVEVTKEPNTWPEAHVDILDGDRMIATYRHNYSLLQTFEPFRQGDRTFALISPDYTATSVLDLDTGAIVAGEEPHAGGFCPVGFYVPDWWDVNDGTILPGSMHWRPADHEWPCGDYGFVWGCIWGDDSSWKVQHLDLSSVSDGVIRREERFGFLRLATHKKLEATDVIRCSSWQGQRRVKFSVEQTFDLGSGSLIADDDL
jgi:hypothetical protein